MPRLRRLVAQGISEAVALTRAVRPPQRGMRVLMYHSVGSTAIGDSLGIYGIAPELFNSQMAALAANTAVSPAALIEAGRSAAHARVAVTFDDGYRDNLYRAAPVLQDLGIPFTVFVCTEFLQDGSGNFLTVAELRELSGLPGVAIGSHGATHTPLTLLDDSALRNELVESRKRLEDITGKPVTAISFPHGAVNSRVRDAAAAAGFTVGACSHAGVNDAARDPLLLCRTAIQGDDSLRIFRQKLRGDWDWYQWRSPDPAKA